MTFRLCLAIVIIISATEAFGQNEPVITLEFAKMTADKLEGIKRNFGFNITWNLADTDSCKVELILARKDSPKYRATIWFVDGDKSFSSHDLNRMETGDRIIFNFGCGDKYFSKSYDVKSISN